MCDVRKYRSRNWPGVEGKEVLIDGEGTLGRKETRAGKE